MPLVTTVKPTGFPVDLAEAKEQCFLTSSDTTHDARLRRYIASATAEVETLTGVVMMSRTMRYDITGFATETIKLPVYPVRSISSIKYDDPDEVEQTVSSSDYYTDLNGMEPIVKAVTYWPSTLYGKPSSVRITFVAGYADSSLIPADLKDAVLVKVYERYSGEKNPAGDMLAEPYRLYRA